MQNGAFGWATSLSSSLAAQKVPWTSGVGYQASLTDLFLKKNSLPFGSGISQLAAASSYLEKMSSSVSTDQHQSDAHHHPHHHHQSQQLHSNAGAIHTLNSSNNTGGGNSSHRKCNHEKSSKNSQSFCDLCHHSATADHFSSSNKSTSHSFSDHLHHSAVGDKSSSIHQQHQQSSPVGSQSSHHMPPPAGPSGSSSHHQQQQQHQHQHQQQSSATSQSSSSSRRNSNRAKNVPLKHFLCPVCHRTFTQKGNLKTHMMIHAGDKPYACQVSQLFVMNSKQKLIDSITCCTHTFVNTKLLIQTNGCRCVARASLKRATSTPI